MAPPRASTRRRGCPADSHRLWQPLLAMMSCVSRSVDEPKPAGRALQWLVDFVAAGSRVIDVHVLAGSFSNNSCHQRLSRQRPARSAATDGASVAVRGVTTGYFPPTPLAGDHDVSAFECRSNEQTDWSRYHAHQSAASGTTRVFVVTEARSSAVVAYYGWCMAQLASAASPARLRRAQGGIRNRSRCSLGSASMSVTKATALALLSSKTCSPASTSCPTTSAGEVCWSTPSQRRPVRSTDTSFQSLR